MRQARTSRAAGVVPAGGAARADRPSAALAAAGVIPSRARGQNFLVQPRVADRIVALANLEAGETALEIGPGLGILTERIAAAPVSRIILIELDARLAARLAQRFAADPRVAVVNRDFMAVERDEFASAAPIKVIGNLPFNSAAAILERLAALRGGIARMTLMFQREVGERIRARPGAPAYGALSAYTALYWEIAEHFRVGAGCFHPRPKVDAEVLAFAPRTDEAGGPAREGAILAAIRAAFSTPRKTLRNALGHTLGMPPAAAENALRGAGIDPAARAGTLGIREFARLAQTIEREQAARGKRDA
ncbi:ribosomal RNA small subunit methyltransferase A [bacterium]|nr:ribosomal RNA small subunit methyltransferase A [bacterium]